MTGPTWPGQHDPTRQPTPTAVADAPRAGRSAGAVDARTTRTPPPARQPPRSARLPRTGRRRRPRSARSAPCSGRGPGTTSSVARPTRRRRCNRARRRGRKLVLVTLYGGNDGLNTVNPVREPGLRRRPRRPGRRRRHGVAAGRRVRPPPRHARIQEAVGRATSWPSSTASASPTPTTATSSRWTSGRAGVTDAPDSTGWLGRWLDGTGSSPLRAIAIGPTLPTALSGARVQGAAIPVGPLVLPGDAAEQALYARRRRRRPRRAPRWLAEAAGSDAGPARAAPRASGPILDRDGHVEPAASPRTRRHRRPEPRPTWPSPTAAAGRSAGNVLAVQLSVVANLDPGRRRRATSTASSSAASTPTPTRRRSQSRLLSQLDTAVTAFVDALRGTRHGSRDDRARLHRIRTAGRRPTRATGTDHGWANVAFAAGPSVKGGFYGEPPSLTKLSEGNTVYTTDFRSLYATMLAEVLGTDPKPFLDGLVPAARRWSERRRRQRTGAAWARTSRRWVAASPQARESAQVCFKKKWRSHSHV